MGSVSQHVLARIGVFVNFIVLLLSRMYANEGIHKSFESSTVTRRVLQLFMHFIGTLLIYLLLTDKISQST